MLMDNEEFTKFGGGFTVFFTGGVEEGGRMKGKNIARREDSGPSSQNPDICCSGFDETVRRQKMIEFHVHISD